MEQDVKKVYDVADIQKILGIGRNKAYEFLDKIYAKKSPFNIIKIGRMYKIPKEVFDKWISDGMYLPDNL